VALAALLDADAWLLCGLPTLLAAGNCLEKGHAGKCLSRGELLVYNDAKSWDIVSATGDKGVVMKLWIRSSARAIKLSRLYRFKNSGDTQVDIRA